MPDLTIFTAETEARLCRRFPWIQHKTKPQGWSSLAFNIGEGWSSLVESLLSTVESRYRVAGYEPDPKHFSSFDAKYGELRLFIDAPEGVEVGDILHDAQNRSLQTCEFCGRPGSSHTVSGWVYTLCPSCLSKEPKGGSS